MRWKSSRTYDMLREIVVHEFICPSRGASVRHDGAHYSAPKLAKDEPPVAHSVAQAKR